MAVAFMAPAAPAAAADLEEGQFSGEARNYGVFAGVGLLDNSVNARANIAESVTVANSEGLSDYSGTGVGEFAVPGSIADDPEARAYSRAAPIGAGAIGIPVDVVNAESYSTTVQDVDEASNDFGNLDIPLLGNLEGLTGATSTTWTDEVLSNGGTVADSVTTTGDLNLISGLGEEIPAPVPGLSDIFPVGSANLGQNTNEVRLVDNGSEQCPGALGVETEATWTFADVQLFGGQVGVSWGGESSGETGTIVASASGQPNGASVDVSTMPSMAVVVGENEFVIEPGLGIELSELLEGSSAESLLDIIDGELVYGGPTNFEEAADGTHASGTMGGLQGDLQLLSVPVVAPDGLGSLELGFERVDVAADVSQGGVNCTDDGGTPDGSADGV
ncbi:hypothetical protein, partial [Nesterenkonia sp. F]|uniref:hypothetical protein n=1 Tax=Nesterenkonia sp. F TaxID=795955 RepID=UPI001112614A